MRKLVGKRLVNEFPIYDIEVKDDHCFELANGVVAHNSMFPTAVISGGCLVADTKLRMFDGSLKQIQDIEVNDLVATLEGPKPVTHIWDPDTLENGTPECYEITFEDGYTVVCSENHPFLTTEGWVEARNISEKHEIVSLPV